MLERRMSIDTNSSAWRYRLLSSMHLWRRTEPASAGAPLASSHENRLGPSSSGSVSRRHSCYCTIRFSKTTRATWMIQRSPKRFQLNVQYAAVQTHAVICAAKSKHNWIRTWKHIYDCQMTGSLLETERLSVLSFLCRQCCNGGTFFRKHW